jgi:hypothetical protein
MEKFIKILVLVLISVAGYSQYSGNNSYGYQFKRLMTDSGLNLPKGDTSLYNSSSRGGALVYKSSDATVYYHNGVKWLPVTSATLDTTSLSNRIDLKLNISDTSSLSNRIDLKLNASDSSKYLKLDGSTTMSGGLNINYTTPIITLKNEDNATFQGIEYKDNTNTLDAYIKHKANTAEMRINSGRGLGWGGHTTFYTDAVERVRIRNDGYVGIGSNDPYSLLEIKGADPLFTLNTTSLSTYAGVDFRGDNTIDGSIKFQPSTAKLRFSMGRGTGWGGNMIWVVDETEKMYLNATGVSIGTSSVLYPLTVSGSIKATSLLDSSNTTGGANSVLTSGNSDKLFWRTQQSTFVLFEGDSQTAGVSTQDSLKTKSAQFKNTYYINNAVSGNKVTDLIQRLSTSVGNNRPANNYTSAYISAYVGTNDAFYSATTSQNVYDSLKLYWSSCKAYGYKVIAYTMADFTGSAGATAAVLAKKDTINNLILSDPSLYDYLVRLDLLLPDASNTTYFSGDNLHFTQVGKSLWLTFLNDAISNNRVLSQNNSYVNYKYLSKGDYSNYATLNFPSTLAGASSDLTITVPGAVNGDAVSVGVSNGSTLANGVFTAWVSAANTVTVRFTNTNLLTALDPASGTFKVFVFKN